MSHIFLYGPSGSGKTSTGKVLAHNLALPFIDLDQEIETKAGMPIGRIMELQGEPAFRNLEAELLQTVITRGESVIALGGGTLLRKDNRKLAEGAGTVIFLTAEPGTLLGRLKSDPNGRPLLSGDLDRQLSTLLANRAGHYNSFPMRIQTDEKTQEQSARQIQISLGRFHLFGMGGYDVLVQDNSLGRIGEMLLRRGLKNPLVVTDENVARLHAAQVISSLQNSGFTPTLLVIPAGETHKTLDTVCSLWQGFLENGLDRSGTVIALGGGLVSDLAGFAASTYMRGTTWVVVPTTLLAMADACLGGKTGFDLPEGKNLIGTFYPPRFVLADPQVLKTLPEAEILSGLAEVVKHGLISDPALFDLCDHGLENVRNHLDEIITRAMAAKIQVIEDDPYESGRRAVLTWATPWDMRSNWSAGSV